MTQVFYQEQESFARFRRTLRRLDQLALDDLFVAARKHLSASAYASHSLPFETFLLAMLLEEHKETQRLRQEVAQIREALPHPLPSPEGRGARLPSPLGGRAGDEGAPPALPDGYQQRGESLPGQGGGEGGAPTPEPPEEGTMGA